eukprot:UN28515
MISVFGKRKQLDEALKIFHHVRTNLQPALPVYNALFAVYAKIDGISFDHIIEINKLCQDMNSKNIKKDTITYNTLIHIHGRVGDMEKAEKLFDEVNMKDTQTYNMLMYGYKRKQDVEECKRIFDRIPHPDAYSYMYLMIVLAETEGWRK